MKREFFEKHIIPNEDRSAQKIIQGSNSSDLVLNIFVLDRLEITLDAYLRKNTKNISPYMIKKLSVSVFAMLKDIKDVNWINNDIKSILLPQKLVYDLSSVLCL